MKHFITLSAILFLSLTPSFADAPVDVLPYGYISPWTGKVLFNSEGGYAFDYTNDPNPIHGWEKLYEAGANDIYTISLPIATTYAANGRVQFKTPISLQSDHQYRFNFSLMANKAIQELVIAISENENDDVELYSRTLDLSAGGTKSISSGTLNGIDIQDAKIELQIPTFDDDVTVTLRNVQITDLTTNKELWVGTSYYNWCYYYSPSEQARIPDMYIKGRNETLSWTQGNFDDSMWQDAGMPIGSSGALPNIQSIWPGGNNTNLWIRRDFEMNAVPRSTRYTLRVLHDDAYSIYVNGHLIDSDNGWTNGTNDVSFIIPTTYLQMGRNVIATYIQQNYGGKSFDCCLQKEDNFYQQSDEDADVQQLEINEVQVANIDQFIDRSFNYGGWIEIYNPTDKRIALDQLFLTDNPDEPSKFVIPQGMPIVPAQGYQVIYFDHNFKDGNYGETSKYQATFKLANEGGSIYLLNTDGSVISSVTYPAAVARCSYARVGDEGETWSMTSDVTPGRANGNVSVAENRLDAPLIDTDSRLFTDAFTVRVEIPQGTTLRYTMDGTAPTKTHGNTSKDGQFRITSTTVLRCCLTAEDALPSTVVTRSYIHRDANYYLPVICITTDDENLYGDSIGVYVDGVNGISGRNHGKSNINMDWERPVNFEYITPDGEMAVNMEAEFTISGGWSRHFAPSSFKIKASKLYEGRNSIDYPFFRYKPYNKYKQLLIRNGGNDNNSLDHGRVRDGITQQVLVSSGVYVDAQDYQPVHVFFNGKYIAQLNLREPNNRYNGTANYGYDDDEMDAFEYSNGYFQMAGTKDAFRDVMNLSTRASDNAVYKQICQLVDIDEYTNYWAAISYIGCSDWICNNNNVKGYRSLPDGKFHLTVLDQDWGWANKNALSLLEGKTGNELLRIYNNIKKNPTWQRRFVDAYCLMDGSVFTPERCLSIGDSICSLVAPALAIEEKQPYTSWNEQKNSMINSTPRATRMQTLRTTYGLGNGMQAQVSANIPEASLMLNGQPIPLNRFNGTLFAPFTLQASAPTGYNFVGWEQAGVAETAQQLIPRGDMWSFWDKGSLDDASWKMGSMSYGWAQGYAPLGYGKNAIVTTISYGDDAKNKIPTYYFRHNVTLKDAPAKDDVFTMNWTADDGFVVYVNGTEVTRYLMPDGKITYDTYATTYAPDNPDKGTFTIPASVMQKGSNVIAVEVHNNVPGSSDIFWDADLQYQPGMKRTIVCEERDFEVNEDKNMNLTAIFEPIKPEYLSVVGSSPIMINEVSASNSIFCNDYYKRQDWIELYNTTDEDIDLAGMFLSDNPDRPEKYIITADNTEAGTIIPAHGHKIIWADKVDPLHQLHAGFKLNNEDSCSVTITAADHSWSDRLTYVAHTGEESVGRYPDGGKRIYHMTRPTINRPNQLTSYAQWVSGEDVNFNEQEYLDAISAPLASHTGGTTEYYTIEGMRVTKPTRGIYIVRSVSPTGTVVTRKVRY